MVRTYKRKLGSRLYRNYTEAMILEAVDKVKSKKMSLREAQQRYGIHRNTIWLRMKGKTSSKNGGQTVFSDEEEQHFVAHAVALSTFGFPLTSFDLRCTVKAYLDRIGKTIPCFKDNFPGTEWGSSFLKRHNKVLSARTAKNITYSRAATDEVIVNTFFDHLEPNLEGIPASNIWNFDETNLVDDPGAKKVITRRGTKYPEQIRNSSKANTSIMVCGNAEGTLAPLYVNYKAERLWNTWTENGPDGCRYNRSKSGWFDHQTFEDWFTFLLLPILKKQVGTKVLIGDNLSSHINIQVLKLCEEFNIKFVALPPNATHLLQPLDVAYFRPMKGQWRKIVDEWKQTASGSRCTSIPKDEFPGLIKKLLDSLPKGKDNLISGFRKTGIFPLNRYKVLERLPKSQMNSNLNSNLQTIVGKTFIEELEKKRKDATGHRQIKRRKRLEVPAGRSICSNDVMDCQPSTSRCGQNNQFNHEDSGSSESEHEQSQYAESEDSIGGILIEDDSQEPKENEETLRKDLEQELRKNDYLLVLYLEEVYPGKVTRITEKGAVVSAMQKSGVNWKWPKETDEMEYERADIITKIQCPKQISKRGVFAVPEYSVYSF